MDSLKIGLIINPIAGVGAALAWKGTDNIEAAWDAVAGGQLQPVWDLVERAVSSIPDHIPIVWYFGGTYKLSVTGEVVYQPPKRSTAINTKEAVKAFEVFQPDLILFAGGDGTAVDVANTTQLPILGIPAGVKIFSPCFLHRPEDLGEFLSNWEGDSLETDLLDLDEEAYRQGIAVPKLMTNAVIPVSTSVQAGKFSWQTADRETFSLIAQRIEEENWLDQVLVIGPGSTMRNIFRELGIELSLLGVDVVSHGELLIEDATREQLDEVDVDQIWITPIGHQGHIFGRGNRQISADLIAKVGKQNIRVFATVEKIRETETLYVDTGDRQTDEMLHGFLSVIVGYYEEILKRVK